MGPRTFEQAAGFLRVFSGSEPLDELPIHPESPSDFGISIRGGRV